VVRRLWREWGGRRDKKKFEGREHQKQKKTIKELFAKDVFLREGRGSKSIQFAWVKRRRRGRERSGRTPAYKYVLSERPLRMGGVLNFN
jgi:hypothetical protein